MDWSITTAPPKTLRLRYLAARHRYQELLARFVGYDAPPAIVAKPGETVTVPIFVSRFSDRQGPVQLRWWVSGFRCPRRHSNSGPTRELTNSLAAL